MGVRSWISQLSQPRDAQHQQEANATQQQGAAGATGAAGPAAQARGGHYENHRDPRGGAPADGGRGTGPAGSQAGAGARGGGGGGGPAAQQGLGLGLGSEGTGLFGMRGFPGVGVYQDSEMERKVTRAARSLGEEVQNIVKAARGRNQNQDEWKIRLLDLLGGESPEGSSYVDILLANSQCSKFVRKCVENELPPNLIHCLRLLRVLELQHAHGTGGSDSRAISTVATSKVSQLLTKLCTDPIVGEQLRPHLFGLLALSGASYPKGGVHIASAASNVILAFSEHCLSSSLVWFLHDEKMIKRMTDDIKDLCGMTTVSNSSVTTCLYGPKAEEAGLWLVALKTVITLVHKSIEHHCVELLTDFDTAGGYTVLQHAISHSSQKHVPKLLELLVLLVCCRTTPEVLSHSMPADGTESRNEDAGQDSSRNYSDSKLATNMNALETIADIMIASIPFLNSYVEANRGNRPALTNDSLKELAQCSVEQAGKPKPTQSPASTTPVDLSSELLVITLQLYSDHTKNYDIIEKRYNILSLYLVAFPSFDDLSVKVLILKTLEYVCTGLMGSDSLTPLNVANEILFAIFFHLFEQTQAQTETNDDQGAPAPAGASRNDNAEDQARIAEALLQDAEMLCDTMEKLIQFDHSMSSAISGCSLIDGRLGEILAHVVDVSGQKHQHSEQPAASTNVDKAYATVCRFLKLMVCHNDGPTVREIFNRLDLNAFLVTAVRDLGDEASQAALSVFEVVMSGNREIVGEEMACVMDLMGFFMDKKSLRAIARANSVLLMLKSVLEANAYAHTAFRQSGGFEVLVRLLFGWEGAMPESGSGHAEGHPMLQSFETTFGVIAAATGAPQTEKQQTFTVSPAGSAVAASAGDAYGDSPGGTSPWELNRRYLRRTGFYRNFAEATGATGILQSAGRTSTIFNFSLALVDPSLPIVKEALESTGLSGGAPNADAARLVLGIALNLPPILVDLGKRALDEIIRLCAPDKSGSSLSLISASGIIGSLTSPSEFGEQLEDRSHPLYSRCMLLLRRVAAFSMTYTDYVALLRFMAGPILRDSDSKSGTIRLPVISSSLKVPLGSTRSPEAQLSPDRRGREVEFCKRLETLSIIAERGDRVARCIVGGDSLNTVALYMQKVPVGERLMRLAADGRIKYVEIPRVDPSANMGGGDRASQASSSNAQTERIWAPFASTGFSYSFWLRLPETVGESAAGSLFMLDISSNIGFLSMWYDLQQQQVCVLSSAASRNEPNRFPSTPLSAGVWHHFLFKYQLPKRPVLMRKAIISMYVDGRLLEADVKVDNVNIEPTARVHVGVPCPKLAASGIVRGSLPFWELGAFIMMSKVITSKEATAIFAAGPEYEGLFWGDRPQRLSFTAGATATFAMLADSGEEGSVACALRRRQVPEVEAAGHVLRERGSHDDSLATVGLLCSVNAEDVVFGFHGFATVKTKESQVGGKAGKSRTVLLNVGRQNGLESAASNAIIHGTHSVICPHSFADNLQWVGGPNVLLPLVNGTQTAASLSLALRLIRASVDIHPPNLESLQAGGGYRILGLLLRQKRIINTAVLDQCFAFAVHGFVPGSADRPDSGHDFIATSENWVFTDLDAMKHLLLNHQIWDLQSNGPELPRRLLSFLNGLVSGHNVHAAFNARRLHLIGIVQWVLHLMLEAAILYSVDGGSEGNSDNGNKSKWYTPAPSISATAVGGDPDNELLLSCKTLLRRILTYMLTPGDLNAAAGAAVYTLSINETPDGVEKDRLEPGPVARVYILRLLEELVVDGVNEIVMANKGGEKGHGGADNADSSGDNQSYLSGSLMNRRKKPQGQGPGEQVLQQCDQQAQAFLSAFSGILTPNWFACILEGCREEASASAAFRLMILLLQSSPTFATAFEEAGGFAPLVLSIPKFSTCPSIVMSMLSQLLHAPILHVPCFATLDAAQLCEVFDSESDPAELGMVDRGQGGLHTSSDPSCGIFALLAECLGRNIQLTCTPGNAGVTARAANEAVLKLLGHRHSFSASFQEFCRTRDFLEPLAQALCLVHEEQLQRQAASNGEASEGRSDRFDPRYTEESTHSHFSQGDSDGSSFMRTKRRGSLSEVGTERFKAKGFDSGSSGIGMVQLLKLVVSHAVLSGPLAASLISALFHSFPIHATPDQVEAFHSLLIEHCGDVIEDALQRGETVALANCIGVSSVFLDRLMAGFFTSAPVFEAVRMVLSVLRGLTTSGSYASRTLSVTDQNMLVADCAHIARLICLCSLQRSRPRGPYDQGDDDLKLAILRAVAENLSPLLLAPSVGIGGQKPLATLSGGHPLSAFAPPAAGSKSHALWQSCSLSRCPSAPALCSYPELKQTEQTDRAFVISVMAEVHICLMDKMRTDVREQSAFLVVRLIQQCPAFMSELLVKEISQGDRTETVDLMNRGGFGALVAESAKGSIAGNSSAVPSRLSSQSRGGGAESLGQLQYSHFFSWLERNEGQVAAVFNSIHFQASRQPAIADGIAATPEEAIEKEQKIMLLKLTSQDTSDRTILGGLKRAELGQQIHEQMDESHALWKRQGLDDMASGTIQWKVLLRQLKGPLSIWEGGNQKEYTLSDSPFSRERLIAKYIANRRDNSKVVSAPPVSNEANDKDAASTTRWKLDLTEGYERQRRRLLPNYEFYGIYNIDDGEESSSQQVASSENDEGKAEGQTDEERADAKLMASFVTMQATAKLLKGIKSRNIYDDEEDEKNDDDDDGGDNNEDGTDSSETKQNSSLDSSSETPSRAASTTDGDSVKPHDDPHSSGADSNSTSNEKRKTDQSNDSKTDGKGDGEGEDENKPERDGSVSSYDLITGLLQPGDWPEKSYNVKRCTGLEVRAALLLWCREAIYIVDGFEQTEGDGLEGKINRIEMSTSTYQVNIRASADETVSDVQEETRNNSRSAKENDAKENSGDDKLADGELSYQHRSHRIALTDLFSVFKRRYQLQQIALEFYDVHRSGILVAFQSMAEREEILGKVLASPLPNSIFSSTNLGGGGGSINYDRFMTSLRARITSQWVSGRMSNFEFLMHLNSFAGRSYNDLTQYPVFPWVLSDYESETIDLNDPRSYRDFSKPMGAQSEARAGRFRENFEVLEANTNMSKDEPPPFHYGTHYSCAAYVLYYLMRLEPFSRLALSLQGGKFDKADRLFHNIGSSWHSASRDNMQDVRELIPEFFYLPEFLVNTNMFDYGATQSGHVVHDVTLPPWAKGDTSRFIRINRQALESEYVSKNLHQWIDLIFGYKQRGREAVKAQNTFVHLTYEGSVDLDEITDPLQREATIAQIHNFGQTPSRLERRPFPQRNTYVVAKDRTIDTNALQSLAYLTPPFCVVGAPHRVHLNVTMWDTCRVGMIGQASSAVGDMCLVRGQIVGIGRCCALSIPTKTYYRYGGANNGVSVHVAVPTARGREVDRLLGMHDGMHRSPISVLKPSRNGSWLISGCTDSTVRVWRCEGKQLLLQATLCGHEGGEVTSIDVSTTFGTIVTGGADGNVLVWDLRKLTFLRRLVHDHCEGPYAAEPARVVSVSINHKNGNILTLVGGALRLFDINGNLLAVMDPTHYFSMQNTPTCAEATDCAEWMEAGVVAVSGHKNGDVMLWTLNHELETLELRHLLQDKVHSCAITAIRIAGEVQDTLLVGDMSGKMSVCKSLRLDALNQQELLVILRELRSNDKSRNIASDNDRGSWYH